MAGVGGVTGPQEPKSLSEKVKEAKWKVFRDIKLTNWTPDKQVKAIIKQFEGGGKMDPYVLERFSTKVLNKLSDTLGTMKASGKLTDAQVKAFREVLTVAHNISDDRGKTTKIAAFDKALGNLPQAAKEAAPVAAGKGAAKAAAPAPRKTGVAKTLDEIDALKRGEPEKLPEWAGMKPEERPSVHKLLGKKIAELPPEERVRELTAKHEFYGRMINDVGQDCDFKELFKGLTEEQVDKIMKCGNEDQIVSPFHSALTQWNPDQFDNLCSALTDRQIVDYSKMQDRDGFTPIHSLANLPNRASNMVDKWLKKIPNTDEGNKVVADILAIPDKGGKDNALHSLCTYQQHAGAAALVVQRIPRGDLILSAENERGQVPYRLAGQNLKEGPVHELRELIKLKGGERGGFTLVSNADEGRNRFASISPRYEFIPKLRGTIHGQFTFENKDQRDAAALLLKMQGLNLDHQNTPDTDPPTILLGHGQLYQVLGDDGHGLDTDDILKEMFESAKPPAAEPPTATM